MINIILIHHFSWCSMFN